MSTLQVDNTPPSGGYFFCGQSELHRRILVARMLPPRRAVTEFYRYEKGCGVSIFTAAVEPVKAPVNDGRQLSRIVRRYDYEKPVEPSPRLATAIVRRAQFDSGCQPWSRRPPNGDSVGYSPKKILRPISPAAVKINPPPTMYAAINTAPTMRFITTP